MMQPTVDSILADPATPYWVSDVVRVALEKDPVDASNAFDI